MKTFLILLFSVTVMQGFCQSDSNGNPILNSVILKEEPVKKYTLVTSYFTVKNNIDRKMSSVYIAENPDIASIEDAALTLPSYTYVLLKDRYLVGFFSFTTYPEPEFIIVQQATGKTSTKSVELKGKITEQRAKELISVGYDKDAVIKDRQLTFNGNQFEIISDADIEAMLIKLLKKEKIFGSEVSDTQIQTQDNLSNFIIAESAKGGKMDYFTEIEGHEYDGVQIEPGVFTTKLSIALYKWGRNCYEIGINTLEDTFALYAKAKGRALNTKEKDNIEAGFYHEWEY